MGRKQYHPQIRGIQELWRVRTGFRLEHGWLNFFPCQLDQFALKSALGEQSQLVRIRIKRDSFKIARPVSPLVIDFSQSVSTHFLAAEVTDERILAGEPLLRSHFHQCSQRLANPIEPKRRPPRMAGIDMNAGLDVFAAIVLCGDGRHRRQAQTKDEEKSYPKHDLHLFY